MSTNITNININTETLHEVTQAWDLVKMHLPKLVEQNMIPADHLRDGVMQLHNLADTISQHHPDVCQICHSQLVNRTDRTCDCSALTCYDCAGKTASLCCPFCRDDDRLLPLIANDKVRLSFSAMVCEDGRSFKPALLNLLRQRRDEADLTELDELRQMELQSDAESDHENQPLSGEHWRLEEHKEHEQKEYEQKEYEQKEHEQKEQQMEYEPDLNDGTLSSQAGGGSESVSAPTNTTNPTSARPTPATKNNEIKRLLDFCWRHGDQRSFAQLIEELKLAMDWNVNQMDLTPAASMDVKTIEHQWFVTANLSDLGKELQCISYLRQGEMYDRLAELAKAGALTTVDQGVTTHHSSAWDFLRNVMGYQKKDENKLRSYHQFYEVWQLFHPIIAVGQSDMSWTWLQSVLTKNTLLDATKAYLSLKGNTAAVHHPAALSYNIPASFQDLYLGRRPTGHTTKFGGQVIFPVLSDSFYIPNALQTLEIDPAALMASLVTNPGFIPRETQDMRYRSHPLPREKFFLVRSPVDRQGQPTTLWKYGYPGFKYSQLLLCKAFSSVPTLERAIDQIQEHLIFNNDKIEFNHVIGTMYSREQDNISFHQDKMTDIEPGSPIVSISLGDQREMHFCPLGRQDVSSYIQVLNAGDMFILGPRTNQTMEHAIVPIGKERHIDRDDGSFSPRVSVVLRDIKTSKTREQAQALAVARS